MRIPDLLVVALFGLLAVVSASAQSPSELVQSLLSQPTPPMPATNLDLSQKPSPDMEIDQYRLPRKWSAQDRFATNLEPNQDEVCYTMRSYKVEGKEWFDDSEHPMEYSTCQPSSRFNVKKADEPAVLVFP